MNISSGGEGAREILSPLDLGKLYEPHELHGLGFPPPLDFQNYNFAPHPRTKTKCGPVVLSTHCHVMTA